MITQAILDEVRKNQDRLYRRIRALVEVESPSRNPGAIGSAINLVQEWLRPLNCDLKTHKNDTFGDVLEARIGAASTQKPVLLLGHLDTVWPVGTLQSMSWREEEGKFFGPGVLDMKAGVVMAIEAITALQVLSIEQPVVLLLNSDEEIGSHFSRAITESVARECSSVFVLEPAQGLAYKTARKGVGNYKLSVKGWAAHAGVDFQNGHSAILEMASIVKQLQSITDLTRGITLNVGTIHGGTRSNVVADECIAEIDVRIPRLADAPDLEAKLHALTLADKCCTIKVQGEINRPPMERTEGTIALFTRAQELAAGLGFELQEAATGGGSDGNFTAALGIPTLDGMGAVGEGAHAAHEQVQIGHLVPRTALLAAMIATEGQ